MGADAWSEWAGSAPKALPRMPPVPAGRPELDDLHALIVHWAARLVGTGDALLWLADDGQRLVVRSGTGRFSASVGRSFRKGEGLAGEVWQTATPLAMTARRPLPDRLGERRGQQGVAAGLCVPLVAGGSVVGVLGVAWSEPGRVVGHAETELLRGLGELAGVAIDRAGRLAASGPEPAERGRGQGWLPGAEERYRALSEQIPAVLYSEVNTPGGAVVYKSPQNQQLLGYTTEEAMQPDFWKTLLHPEDRERVLADNERCDRTGDPWHVEYRVFAKDGRVVWLRDHAVLVRGEHGEPDFWQGYHIDITEQKQAEAALRQALERERQALERERQAAHQLRALDAMKNTFLDAVSHELRTALAAVIGIALTLKRARSRLGEEDTVDLVDRLVANAGKLDRLLTDLLDLDRLSKGIVAPQRSRTDLAALVGRVAEEWRQRSGRRLEVVVEPVVAWVDAAKVERVVENLLANAGRHTAPDTPVWVRVARRGEGCCWPLRMPVAESRRSCGRPCLNRSAGDPGRMRIRRGWASACRWWPASPSCTAGGPGSRTARVAARRFGSCSQTPPSQRMWAAATPGEPVCACCWWGSSAALARVGCANSFMQLAGARAGDRRGGRVGAQRSGSPRQ
jgi:PAS domain S-box-containing protein